MPRRLLFALLAALALSPASAYRLQDPFPGAKESFYSTKILAFLDAWPPPTLALPEDGRGLIVRAIKTPGRPQYIGLVKHQVIHAPLERVAALIEGFEDYPRIWRDVLKVSVEAKDGNRAVTSWLRERPAFFLPKLHYRMLYVWDKSAAGRVVYRQQLIDGNALNSNDALVVVERLGESSTRVSVLNFFEPNCGPFRALIESRIWKKSLEGSIKDDLAFRARAEHPDWDLKRVSQEAEQGLEREPLDKIAATELIKL